MTLEERRRAREILDVEEGIGPVPLLDARGIRELLVTARRIAIVGASADPSRPSHRIMRYLMEVGYACVPVNPFCTDVLGIPAVPSLEAAAADAPIDIVDVFRRPNATPDVAREAVRLGVRALWLQVGVVNWEAARIAHEGGLQVVMDRCTMVDHASLVGTARG